ncbi:MAG: hypothetical protein A2020_07620 [Lentisphaerae bacterium GWF2_45_14]|nr:MAG: hypothetical protein A2020_07620 [Lentisphaerae bacterium GWF2_45_14]
MLHPASELKHINNEIGFGVFATKLIPAGTITYIKDPLEIIVPESSCFLSIPEYRDCLIKYSYSDPDGTRVMSWDIARFMNHNCGSNTLTTGYNFEIAIRDIKPGDEITDDYGLFIGDESLICSCGSPECRSVISSDNFDMNVQQWDRKLKAALAHFKNVEQPLSKFIDNSTRRKLGSYLEEGKDYNSIRTMKWKGLPITQPPGAEVNLAMSK